MKRLNKSSFIKIILTAVMLITYLSADLTALAKVAIDYSIESSRDAGTDLYDASRPKNDLPLNISISDGTSSSKLLDERYTTSVTLDSGTVITVTSETAMTGMYIIWDSLVPEWTLTINGKDYTYGKYGYLHEYIDLPESATEVKITIPNGSVLGARPGVVSGGMRVADIYAFANGNIPSYVQQWEPVLENADILAFSTHADDEQIFLGSIGPIYQAEKNVGVQFAFLCQHWDYDDGYSKVREHEKLTGLWVGGVRHYPILGDIKDGWSESREEALRTTDENQAKEFVVDAIRRTKPQVVVTQALDGEYGHGQHMVLADSVVEAVEKGADKSYYPDSANKYGTWDTPKLYLHTYGDNPVNLDMRTPLVSYGGKRAIDVARQAYLCHDSQQFCWFTIDDYGPYSCARFGLYRSLVGEDKNGDDLLENITPYELTGTGTESGVTSIYSAEDLCKVADNPYGDYILQNDIDMSGVDWTPIDFYGTFDGNDHAIMNLDVVKCGNETRTTYDGNMKTYDTSFAGLFGVLEGATVKNLDLMGIFVNVSSETDTFVGSIAGYLDKNTVISKCRINGTMSLQVSAKMIGVGGIVGYGGKGAILNTDADVTLICTDLDKENRDEQFLGGAYSAGFTDVDGVNIKIAGYDSDHGYVHNGGLVGMYILYPAGNTYEGYLRNTNIDGFITFFEDNTNRRAYCKDFIGEVMNWTYSNGHNTSSFVSDERFEYDVNLKPHYCEGATYSEEVVAGNCYDCGYTQYTCQSCDKYTFRRAYTPKVHNYGEAEVTIPAMYSKEGQQKRTCLDCGSSVYEAIPVIDPNMTVVSINPDDINYMSISVNNLAAADIEPAQKESVLPVILNVIKKILLAILILAAIAVVLVIGRIVYVQVRMKMNRKKRRSNAKSTSKKLATSKKKASGYNPRSESRSDNFLTSNKRSGCEY